jgi:hypothetical protein
MTTWIAIAVLSALTGFICARKLSGWMGAVAAGAIPWFGLLAVLLFMEYVLPYQGGGASMWPIAQLFGGTVAAVVGVLSYAVSGRAGGGGGSVG